jgi:hypothetical protein
MERDCVDGRVRPFRIGFASPALALLAIALCGCYGPQPIEPKREHTPFPQITLVDPDLARVLVVSEPRVDLREGGSIQVSVPARLATSGPGRTIQYQFRFETAEGHSVPPTPMWMRKSMAARQEVLLEGASIDGRAKKWFLEIRNAR